MLQVQFSIFLFGTVLGTAMSSAKMAELIEMQTIVGTIYLFNGGTNWRHRMNKFDWSVYGSDAALCLIIWPVVEHSCMHCWW